MAATTIPATFPIPRRSLGEWIALFALEAKCEILKYVRMPIFAISTLMFPTMFYVLFGIVLPNGNERFVTAARTLKAQLAAAGYTHVGRNLCACGGCVSADRRRRDRFRRRDQ